jgi:hypothetical protein
MWWFGFAVGFAVGAGAVALVSFARWLERFKR